MSCDNGLKEKIGLLPKIFISLFEASSNPSGVSDEGILGNTSNISLILILIELLFSCKETISDFKFATFSISNLES